MTNVVEHAKETGYVETLFGRRRYLPELSSSNFNLRSFGERVAMNMPIQGTAADIIKIAMIRVVHRLEKEGLRARLILQVHLVQWWRKQPSGKLGMMQKLKYCFCIQTAG